MGKLALTDTPFKRVAVDIVGPIEPRSDRKSRYDLTMIDYARLRAVPFNITIIQVYAPTSGHDDSEVDHFYQKLQETIDQTPKKDILVVQGDWNAKVGKDAQADWGEIVDPTAMSRQMREVLDF